MPESVRRREEDSTTTERGGSWSKERGKKKEGGSERKCDVEQRSTVASITHDKKKNITPSLTIKKKHKTHDENQPCRVLFFFIFADVFFSIIIGSHRILNSV